MYNTRKEDESMNEKVERYYQFSNGLIIKAVGDSLTLYVLNDHNEWEKRFDLYAKFYDAASDYVELTEDEVKYFIEKRKGQSR